MDFPLFLKYPNDFYILSYKDKFENVQSFDNIAISINGLTANSNVELSYRYSVNGIEYSQFSLLDISAMATINSLLIDNSIYLEVRFKRSGTDLLNTISIQSFSFQITYLKEPLDKCKYECYNYDEKMNSVQTSIISDCPNVFDIYNLKNYTNYNKDLNNAVSRLYGHCVHFFKTVADYRSKDVVLKEYSLYNVIGKEEINIVVPDNAFPSNETRFSSFELDFMEMPFEVHIDIKEFESKFKKYCNDGAKVRPEKEDYIYFPLTNRMYQIDGAFLYKEFMQQPSYYKVTLVKYQDKSNIIVPTDYEINPSQLLSIESNFGDERIEEIEQITKPYEYVEKNELVVKRNKPLEIVHIDLSLNYEVFSKHHYDFSKFSTRSIAVEYSRPYNIQESLSFMMWFKFKKAQYRRNTINSISSNGTNTNITFVNVHNMSIGSQFIFDNYTFSENRFIVDTIIDSYTISIIDIGLTYAYNPTDIKTVTYLSNDSLLESGTNFLASINRTSIEVSINSNDYSLELPSMMKNENWYAFIFNASTSLNSWNISLYELPYKYSRTNPLSKIKQNAGALLGSISASGSIPYTMYSQNDLNISNIRILDRIIEEELHQIMLTQYILKDSDRIELMDNCEPASRLPYYQISK